MKKQMVVIFNILCMALSLNADIKQSVVNRLENIKSRLDKEVDEIKKCVKRDQNCDPTRKKIYISIATIGPLILAATTAGTVAYFVKRKKKIGKKEPLFGPRESVLSPVRESSYSSLAEEFESIPISKKPEAVPASVQATQPQQESIQSEVEKSEARVQPTQPQQAEESRESEGEEEFFSASESEYESAEEEGSQEAASPSINLMRRIETITNLVENQIQLLTDSLMPGMPETPQIQNRLTRASAQYLKATEENDPQKKLDLLQEAYKISREPYKASK